MFNAGTGLWSTAVLSQSRSSLAATSVGNYALFAGGNNQGVPSNRVDIFNCLTGLWSTASLSEARQSLGATTVGQYAVFAGGNGGTYADSTTVDIFDSLTGAWSTATLPSTEPYIPGTSVGTSVGKYALFSDGYNVEILVIPEPATLSLLVIGGLALLRRRTA
jgi:hypothetical protein